MIIYIYYVILYILSYSVYIYIYLVYNRAVLNGSIARLPQGTELQNVPTWPWPQPRLLMAAGSAASNEVIQVFKTPVV